MPGEAVGLVKDSVANPSQIFAIDRPFLVERVGKLSPKLVAQIIYGIEVVLGRCARGRAVCRGAEPGR